MVPHLEGGSLVNAAVGSAAVGNAKTIEIGVQNTISHYGVACRNAADPIFARRFHRPAEEARQYFPCCLSLLIALALLGTGTQTRAQDARGTAAASASTSAVQRSSVATQRNDIPYQASITHVQPMTGLVLWPDHEQVETDAIAMEFLYVGYDQVSDGVMKEGEFQFGWESLDESLDEVAARGHQAILRFYDTYPGKPSTIPESIKQAAGYRGQWAKSEGKKTEFADWGNRTLQAFLQSLLNQFAERYDRDRRIAFFEFGFGLWGEYHIYDGPSELGRTMPSKDFQATIAKQLASQLKDLPWMISVDAADSENTPFADDPSLLGLRFGLFDDSFLCKSHAKENAKNWKTFNNDRWQTSPAGGELSYYEDRDQRLALSEKGPYGIPFAMLARQFHISFMIGNDQPEHQTMARIKQASQLLGYRFRLTRLQTDGASVHASIVNDGIAPIYRDAFLAFDGERTRTSLRGLLPGASIDVSLPSTTTNPVISIQSDAILPAQQIEFQADLKGTKNE
jgi:hypothetical protein